MGSPQIIHFGVQKEVRQPRITLAKVSSSYSTKSSSKSTTWILHKIYLRTQHSDPFPWFNKEENKWNPSTSSSPVPNSCKTRQIPKPFHPHRLSQRTLKYISSGPNLCTEQWRWRSASSNFSPTPETFHGWGVGMDSFRWTVEKVRWTRWFSGGQKSPGQISSCTEVSG